MTTPWASEGKTVLYAVAEGKLLGAFAIEDEIRPESKEAVKELHRLGMATAMWYSGDADGAIKQYEQSLKFQPTHAQTLFNMGIVMWQGKKDGKRAIQIWERLLASNPSYPDRPKVQQLLDQVKREIGSGS